MAVKLTNNFISVSIKEKGAELESLFHKAHHLEYIWNANPKFWGKSSPILFPIVGQLKSDTYQYKNKTYSLPRHGFARDHIFEVESRNTNKAVFLLKSSVESKEVYPFDFELRVVYTIEGEKLNVEYQVKNLSDEVMFFSLGAHPAFNVPLIQKTKYTDYYLEFSEEETAPRWTITKQGQIDEPESFLHSATTLPLDKKLFSNDALVFKGLKSTRISLRSTVHAHGFHFAFEGFPFFGIWAAPDADFVCLEPWCGIADSVKHNQELSEKEGIQKIECELWSRSWSVTCF
jgi:galactose mutarotase-like enzyme